MTVQFTPIRYFTGQDVEHYTVDNRPLQDIDQNLTALKDAVEELQDNSSVLTSQGDWSSMVIEIDVGQDRAKSFAFILNLWAHQDISNFSSPTTCLKTIAFIGYNDAAGNVTFLNNVERFTQHVTAPVTLNFGSNVDKIRVTFSGYTGSNGYVSARVDRYGR